MNYKSFCNKINEGTNFLYRGKVYHYKGNELFLGGVAVAEADSLEEARAICEELYIAENLKRDFVVESYSDIPEEKIVSIIREQHNVRITDSLIESYLELTASKVLTNDPVVYAIRKLNKFDKVLENKMEYILDDGTKILINETTLKGLLDIPVERVQEVRKNKQIFMQFINDIQEY